MSKQTWLGMHAFAIGLLVLGVCWWNGWVALTGFVLFATLPSKEIIR